MTGGDSRRSSDETNGLLPNNKLILYSEVSRSWLDVNYLLMHVNTCTHVYHYTYITYHTCTCIFTQHTYTYIHKAHSYTHTDDCTVKCDEPNMMSNSPKVPECNLSSCNRTIAISVTSCSCLCFSEIKVEQNVLSPLQLVDCFICSKNGSSPL